MSESRFRRSLASAWTQCRDPFPGSTAGVSANWTGAILRPFDGTRGGDAPSAANREVPKKAAARNGAIRGWCALLVVLLGVAAMPANGSHPAREHAGDGRHVRLGSEGRGGAFGVGPGVVGGQRARPGDVLCKLLFGFLVVLLVIDAARSRRHHRNEPIFLQGGPVGGSAQIQSFEAEPGGFAGGDSRPKRQGEVIHKDIDIRRNHFAGLTGEIEKYRIRKDYRDLVLEVLSLQERAEALRANDSRPSSIVAALDESSPEARLVLRVVAFS